MMFTSSLPTLQRSMGCLSMRSPQSVGPMLKKHSLHWLQVELRSFAVSLNFADSKYKVIRSYNQSGAVTGGGGVAGRPVPLAKNINGNCARYSNDPF